MHRISVTTSGCYNVLVDNDLFENAAAEVSAVTQARNICIVSDEIVWSLWGSALEDSLKSAGYQCCRFLIPPGEEQKRIENCVQIWEFLSQKGFGRQDCLIALGGGVVGDLTGFAAATYLRGIDYIQIPTTLLSMVDSSIGGKTAVNLESGKNLAGAFYQPKLVLCSTNTLTTLPEACFLDGCAEVIKYAILFDPQLFAVLETCGLDFPRETVIAQCIRHKGQIVQKDEFDRRDRMLLNLGHSIGHALETLSGYTLSHGKGVAVGIASVSRCAAYYCVLQTHTCCRILALLEAFRLPVSTDYTVPQICGAMKTDKKRSDDTLQMIVPRNIGDCIIMPIPLADLEDFIKKGL